ncbi:trypsin-like serine protease [Streptomyces sp. NPDC002952]|uniref:trypsin-like serine protease n=1 Tax=Streptomyces sp. NPDC002952 TaxID=3364673 RepID=UPI0036BBC53A
MPSKGSTKLLVAAMAVVATSGLLTLPAGAANEESSLTGDSYEIPDPVPGGFASWSDLMSVQNSLNRRADEITETAEAAGVANGLGSIIVSAPMRRIDLYWKGSLPSSVLALVDDLPSGQSVKVHDASYTLAQLKEAAAPLTQQAASSDGTRIVRITPRPEADGLEIGVVGNVDAARNLTAVAKMGIPSTIVNDGGVAPESGNRDGEFAPYHGGGGVWRYKESKAVSYNMCSTGFAVSMGYNSDGIITANHCGRASENAPPYDDSMYIADSMNSNLYTAGSRNFSSVERDISTYKLSGTYKAKAEIFRGAVGSTFSSPVTGSLGVYLGDYVCTSGAMTGEHCSITVDRVWDTILTGDDDEIHWRYEMASGRNQLPGAIASGGGDSGGPVFTPNSYGVTAMGVISYGDVVHVPCESTKFNAGTWPVQTICYNRVGFQPINAATLRAGVTLKTS